LPTSDPEPLGPPDLLKATRDAVYNLLDATVPKSVAPVFDHVPENTQPPMIIVGDIESEPGESKGTEDLTFEIYSVFRGQGRGGLLRIMHWARTTLEQGRFEASDVTFESLEWQSSASVSADDGVTYAGTQAFRVTAEPA
jgi:hypothetical protein